MCGFTDRPSSTAFLASNPAASSTPGLEVLVQEVIAAISTSPLRTSVPSKALWTFARSSGFFAKPFSATSTCDTTICGHGILNAQAAVAAAQALGPASQKRPAVEYFNAGFGHYFMTADPDEIAGLDGGAYGGAFVRTGRQFNAWSTQAAGTVPVCRFFTTPGTFGTKSSHFYTANPVECDGLKLNPNWIYEKIAFFIAVPTNGVCPGGTIPVYRMYNHGQTGAPNHRFTTDFATYQLFTTTMGWDPEGIGFCSPP